MPTVVITGANRGIGLAHVRRFSARGWRVRAAVRAPEAADALASLAAASEGRITRHAYDATDLESAARLADTLGSERVDLLFANAGVGEPPAPADGRRANADFMQVVRVNTLAPLALAEAFADQLADAGRGVIAFQSSQLGSLTDNQSGGRYAYRASKAALNMVARSLAVDLAPRGVIVVTLHPGWVKTDMGGPGAPVEPDDCAVGQQALFDRLTDTESGRFFDHLGRELPW